MEPKLENIINKIANLHRSEILSTYYNEETMLTAQHKYNCHHYYY